MKLTRLLFVAAGSACAVWLFTIALYIQLTSYDPYSWAVPGEESDRSRSLWLARRSLYGETGLVAFVCAALLFGLAIIYRRRYRTKIAPTELGHPSP